MWWRRSICTKPTLTPGTVARGGIAVRSVFRHCVMLGRQQQKLWAQVLARPTPLEPRSAGLSILRNTFFWSIPEAYRTIIFEFKSKNNRFTGANGAGRIDTCLANASEDLQCWQTLLHVA